MIWVVLIPLVAAALTAGLSPFLSERSRTPERLAIGGAFLQALVMIYIVMGVVSGNTDVQTGPWVLAEPIAGIPMAFHFETLSLLFALVASILWFATTLYAAGYMRAHGETRLPRFYCFLGVAISATLALAFSANLFTMFVFYELLTLSTWPLVVHTEDETARRGGRTYLGILIATSIGLFLPAIVWVYQLSGTVAFTSGGVIPAETSGAVLSVLLLMFVIGVGKSAMMPAHRWLPAAMVAPTPVSAFLHAVAVVKAGVFALTKIVVYIFGFSVSSELLAHWVIWLPAITILLASLVAMREDNLKRRLAYSTISQLSYIVLAVLLFSPEGTLAAGMHITMHAFAKITLFFAAGAILIASHCTRVSELDGMGRRMPLVFICLAIASLSVVGLPPTGGLWSKWFLGQSIVTSDYPGAWVLLGVILVSALLNSIYLLGIAVRAFVRPFAGNTTIKAVPRTMQAAMLIATGATLLLFLLPMPLYEWLSTLSWSTLSETIPAGRR